MEEQVVDREQLTALRLENGRVSGRLDSLLEVTQKDRVQSTVDKLDLSSYIEHIARLKKSEQQLKLRLKQQQLSQNKVSNSSADVTAKYANVLEENKTYQSQLDTCQTQLAQNITQSRAIKDELTLKQTELDMATSKRDEIESQIYDLKQSVSIKLSAADDL